MWAWVQTHPAALDLLALSPYAQSMAESLYRMLWPWLICVLVTVAVSIVTAPRPLTLSKVWSTAAQPYRPTAATL